MQRVIIDSIKRQTIPQEAPFEGRLLGPKELGRMAGKLVAVQQHFYTPGMPFVPRPDRGMLVEQFGLAGRAQPYVVRLTDLKSSTSGAYFKSDELGDGFVPYDAFGVRVEDKKPIHYLGSLFQFFAPKK